MTDLMAASDTEIKYIDIASTFAKSDSGILKKMPPFMVRILARIVKQDELNHILNKYSGDVGVDFLVKIIEEFHINLEIEGRENLPENGKCFFVANHPFGVADGLVLTRIVSEKYGTLKAIANDAFMLIPQMHPLVAAVNVFGHSSKDYIIALNETYNMDVPITHFPAGLVSRRFNGKIQDPEWQKSFITKAISSQRDVVPFYFYGRNSRLFYAIFIVRQWFGIKMNLELALLPREMFRKKNKTIKVKIGRPLSWQMFDQSKSHVEWAQIVREQVYKLKDEN